MQDFRETWIAAAPTPAVAAATAQASLTRSCRDKPLHVVHQQLCISVHSWTVLGPESREGEEARPGPGVGKLHLRVQQEVGNYYSCTLPQQVRNCRSTMSKAEPLWAFDFQEDPAEAAGAFIELGVAQAAMLYSEFSPEMRTLVEKHLSATEGGREFRRELSLQLPAATVLPRSQQGHGGKTTSRHGAGGGTCTGGAAARRPAAKRSCWMTPRRRRAATSPRTSRRR